MKEKQNLPDANRLSILSACVFLIYVLIPFIKDPGKEFAVSLPGVVFYFKFNNVTLMSLLVIALTAVGMDWLLRSHPRWDQKTTYHHLILPAITAGFIAFPLGTLSWGPQWWAVFGMGGLLLILVIVAEYIVVDLSDMLAIPAIAGLTAISFALYLFVVITARSAGLRLYALLPVVVIPMFFACLRTLYLRLSGNWFFVWAIAISLIIGQISIGLHYLPVSPLAFGLLLIGPAYALTSFSWSIEEHRPLRAMWVEPVMMWLIFWGIAAAIER
jgi:hypothetical protein